LQTNEGEKPRFIGKKVRRANNDASSPRHIRYKFTLTLKIHLINLKNCAILI
jgi:hypothetical protein